MRLSMISLYYIYKERTLKTLHVGMPEAQLKQCKAKQCKAMT